MKAFSRTTLVLDALDECDEENRPHIILALEHIISDSRNVKVIISSRRNDDIKFRLEKKAKANIGISATDNEGDIVKFVTDAIERNQTERRHRLSCELQVEIKKTLLEKSNGM